MRRLLGLVIASLISTVSWGGEPTSKPADIKVVVVGTTWCPYCKHLKLDLVEKEVFNPSTDLNGPRSVAGAFSFQSGQTTLTASIQVLNLDKMSATEKADIDREYPGIEGYPANFYLLNDKIVMQSGGDNLRAIQNILSATYADLVAKERLESLKHSPDFVNFRKEISSLQPRRGSVALLLGSASDFKGNPIFTSQVLSDTRTTLISEGGLDKDSIFAVYGADSHTTPAVVGRDILGNPIAGDSLDIGPHVGANRTSILALIERLNELKPKNTLMFVAGHGTTEGALLWKEDSLRRSELKLIKKDMPGNVVMVNGTCHGGVYAGLGACGFYAARPERLASGCYEHTELRKNRDDYATKFFDSLQSPKEADLDHNGEISFKEAHWFAVLNGSSNDVPYTDLDYLSDILIEAVSQDSTGDSAAYHFSDMLELLSYGTEEERNIFVKLLKRSGFSSSQTQDLFFFLNGKNVLEDIIVYKKFSIFEALKKTGNPFHRLDLSTESEPKLIHLLRRFFARALLANEVPAFQPISERWKSAEACENQSIKGFLSGQ